MTLKPFRLSYDPARDFMRVRDFLAETWTAPARPFNWRPERWNYARYFVAPMRGDRAPARRADIMRCWDQSVGLWQNGAGEIVAAVVSENPDCRHPSFGQVFLQRRPNYDLLLDELLDYAELTYGRQGPAGCSVQIWEHDTTLVTRALQRNYHKDDTCAEKMAEFVIPRQLPPVALPPGYRVRSMAEEHDLGARVKILGLGFNHTDPADWASVDTYRELQRAPDYRPQLDLLIQDPDGEFVACCLIWYDERTRTAGLEPVATRPDRRRMGLGRAVVLAAIQRVAALGAKKVYVGSEQPFYQALGFEVTSTSYLWRQPTPG